MKHLKLLPMQVVGWSRRYRSAYALRQALDVDTFAEDDDIATVAGLVIAANGHVPRR